MDARRRKKSKLSWWSNHRGPNQHTFVHRKQLLWWPSQIEKQPWSERNLAALLLLTGASEIGLRASLQTRHTRREIWLHRYARRHALRFLTGSRDAPFLRAYAPNSGGGRRTRQRPSRLAYDFARFRDFL